MTRRACPPHLLAVIGLFALCLAGCAKDVPAAHARLNYDASPLGSLPANPLHWKVITSSIHPADSTMSTLYGNDIAVAYARSHAERDYPAGAILSLVTWTQQEDPRWFGAKIPFHVKSVEFVFVNAADSGKSVYSYQSFDGSPLRKSSEEAGSTPSAHAESLLSQRAAVLP
jgi:hypothetical protein